MANKHSEIQIGDGSLHIGDRVVYPNQGICRITGVEVKQIAGRDWEVVTLSREEDGATVMVPREKVMGIGLRKVANIDAIDEVFDQLAAPGEEAQLDWKVRHRENADRMSGGGLFGTVEVLKSLHLLSRIRPLPQKERELYDNARHLLVGEIAAAMNIPIHVAEDNLDYALWPPEGMKRKGKLLVPATLGPPAGPAKVARSEDADDLDFEDDDEGVDGAQAVKPAAGATADEEETDEDEETPAQKQVPKPVAKPAAKAKPEAKSAAGSMNLLADLAARVRGAGREAAPVPSKPETKKAPAAKMVPAAKMASAAKKAPAVPAAAKPAHAPAKAPPKPARKPAAQAAKTKPVAKAKPAPAKKPAPAAVKRAAAAPAKKAAPAAKAKKKGKAKK